MDECALLPFSVSVSDFFHRLPTAAVAAWECGALCIAVDRFTPFFCLICFCFESSGMFLIEILIPCSTAVFSVCGLVLL